LRNDFDVGLGGFTLDNNFGRSNGLWHLTTARAGQSGHSASNSLYYGQNEVASGNGDYDTDLPNEGVATSPMINLASVLPPLTLTFNHLIQTELGTNWDRTTVEISTNEGASFSVVGARFLDDSLPADSAGQWVTQAVDLTAFAASEARIRFHFDSLDSSTNGYEGWFIDDIIVSGQAFPLASAPMASGSFLNGSWTGNITALAPGTNVVVVVDDTLGHKGSTTSFEVIGDPQVWIVKSEDQVVVTWKAVAGETYRLQTKAGIEASWNNAGSDITATTSAVSVTNSLTAPQKFYRVLRLP